nr:hypothetical protein [Marinicella sp. W31]MDC2877826.1 hypothetical protein [Marinicella sp. W31]
MTILLAVIVCGLLSIVYALWATRSVMVADQGTPRMKEIAGFIREGRKPICCASTPRSRSWVWWSSCWPGCCCH